MSQALFSPAWIAITLVGNHLWQSTLFALVAVVLTLALRKNSARIRHWVWLVASVKFLVPFAPLVALGRHFAWQPAQTDVQQQIAVWVDAIGQPLSPADAAVVGGASSASGGLSTVASAAPYLLILVWGIGCVALLAVWSARWRRVAAAVREGHAATNGRCEVVTLRRLERICGVSRPIQLIACPTTFEPGIFGILRPTLLWPQALSEQLSEAQIEAVIAHEIAHVRRHDNLAAAVHMMVEALFWFHPVVWWLGTRLVDERERACDEDVVRFGSSPETYASSILSICKLSVESPLPCVSGVTGSDLKRRIASIMRNSGGEALDGWRKLVLMAGGLLVVAAPIAVGMSNAPLRAQASSRVSNTGLTFDVATVKSNVSGDLRASVRAQPGGTLTITNNTLFNMIRNAYNVQPFQVVAGERSPDWLDRDRWDILAKAENGPTQQQMIEMLRNLLAERFKLAVRRETREMPIYALVVGGSGRFGPQLRTSSIDCQALTNAATRGGNSAPAPGADRPFCGTRTARGSVTTAGVPIADFARNLASMTDRLVVDKTGLTGNFDLELKWTPDQIPGDSTVGSNGPLTDGTSLFTAIQEQLGLKLEAQRGLVEVLVIESAEVPTEDGAFTASPASTQADAQPQTASESVPTFEVASVKPNTSGGGGFTMDAQPGGRLSIVNTPVKLLIRNAYRLQDSQILNGPSWLDSDRFDIAAKAAGNPSLAQLSLMLRGLLFDRFKLRTHNETRELPIYTLVKANAEGKLGPSLRPAEPCFRSPNNEPPQSPPLLGPPPCGSRNGPANFSSRGVGMVTLATSLSTRLSRIVVDATGLIGNFDFDLAWEPDQPQGTTLFPVATANGPSIFTALQEQLGLKLVPTTGPVEVLVIDSVERPTEN